MARRYPSKWDRYAPRRQFLPGSMRPLCTYCRARRNDGFIKGTPVCLSCKAEHHPDTPYDPKR